MRCGFNQNKCKCMKKFQIILCTKKWEVVSNEKKRDFKSHEEKNEIMKIRWWWRGIKSELYTK